MSIPPITTSTPSGPSNPSGPSSTDRNATLYKSAQALEGVFVQQMYKAMRTTVPSNPLLPTSAGEEMFTGLLDEHLAADTPKQWDHGLSEAIYRQLLRSAHSHDSSSASS